MKVLIKTNDRSGLCRVCIALLLMSIWTAVSFSYASQNLVNPYADDDHKLVFGDFVAFYEEQIDKSKLSEADLEVAKRRLSKLSEPRAKMYLDYLKAIQLVNHEQVVLGYGKLEQVVVQSEKASLKIVEEAALDRLLSLDNYFLLSKDIAERSYQLKKLAAETSDPRYLIRSDVWLINNMLQLGDLEKAKEYLSSLHQRAVVHKDAVGLAFYHLYTAEVGRSSRDKPEVVVAEYKQALEYFEKTGLKLFFLDYVSMTKLKIAAFEEYLGHRDKADALIREVVTSSLGDNKRHLAELSLMKGSIEVQRGNYANAKKELQRALELSDKLEELNPSQAFSSAVKRELAEACFKLGDYKTSADLFREILHAYENPTLQEAFSKAVVGTRINEEDELKKRVVLAESLKDEQEKRLAAQEKVLLLMRVVMALLALVMLLIVGFVVQMIKKQRELVRLSTTDHLTQVYNRDMMMKLIASSPYEDNYLLLLDIDNFKQINDVYGHQIGDQVLAKVAHTLKNTVRELDRVARYGGEEFLVLVQHADEEVAKKIAERIRVNVASIDWDELTLLTTVSVGLTEVWGKDIEAALKEADELMYKAKATGKNRICIHRDGSCSPD